MRERWFTITISGSVDEDMRLDGAPSIDEYLESYFGELLRGMLDDTPIRVGDIKLEEARWSEADKPRVDRIYLEGTIKQATWERSQEDKGVRMPYIRLAIVTKELIPRVLYKAYAVVVPLLPGMLSPIAQLEIATGIELKVPASGKVNVGESLPELVDKEVALELEDILVNDKWVPYIVRMAPKQSKEEQ